MSTVHVISEHWPFQSVGTQRTVPTNSPRCQVRLLIVLQPYTLAFRLCASTLCGARAGPKMDSLEVGIITKAVQVDVTLQLVWTTGGSVEAGYRA
jgi:hypothetical protein